MKFIEIKDIFGTHLIRNDRIDGVSSPGFNIQKCFVFSILLNGYNQQFFYHTLKDAEKCHADVIRMMEA